MKILLLKGLPGSGKSTFARQVIDGKDFRGGNWTRVNKDDLRAMMHNSKHTKGNEAMVLKIRDEIIMQALNKGHNVIVDDTNFNPIHEQRIYEIAKCYKKCDVEVKFIDTPVEECITNDLKRPNSVGEKVIRTMYNEWLKDLRPVPIPEVIEGKPRAVICDIDGTLAHMTNRSPYDWMQVGEDTVDSTVAGLLKLYDGMVVLVSGRDSVCREVTKDWLGKHGVDYDELFMRPEGNTEKDTVIKQRIYEGFIKGHYNIDFVLDDRNSVVEMWRGLGLKVLQVEPGDF